MLNAHVKPTTRTSKISGECVNYAIVNITWCLELNWRNNIHLTKMLIKVKKKKRWANIRKFHDFKITVKIWWSANEILFIKLTFQFSAHKSIEMTMNVEVAQILKIWILMTADQVFCVMRVRMRMQLGMVHRKMVKQMTIVKYQHI